MTITKLVISVGDRTLAHHIGGVLSDLFEPAPDAVTVFENPKVSDTQSADPADEVSAEAIGDGGWLIEAYYHNPPPDADKAAASIAAILDVPAPPCRLEKIPDENWVALSQAALPPVFAGRFSIYGSHDRDRIGRGWNTIQIDAGEAFGTAHHATTYGCLVMLDRLTRRRRFGSVLDLGTGSGVLALAMQRVQPEARIIATDLDLRSVEVAKTNAADNALTGRHDQSLQFVCAGGLAHPVLRQRMPFDLVVANILAGPLMTMAGDIARATRTGAYILLSGILVRQAAEVSACYRAHGFALRDHNRYEEWSTLVFVKIA